MPAALAIGGLAAAGSIGSALIGSNAAQAAANTQQQTELQTAQMQEQMGQQAASLFPGAVSTATNYLSPFASTNGLAGVAQPLLSTGSAALTSLASLYGLSTPGNPGGAQGQSQAWNQMLQTPAYNFAQQQGTLGIDRSAAANGLLLSGGQLKDLSTFDQGLASQQVGNYTNVLSGLGNLYGQGAGLFGQGLGLQQQAASGIGQYALQGAQGQASALTGTAQMVGNSLNASGQSAASGIVGSANALTGGINNAVTNSLTAYGLSNQPNNPLNTSQFGGNILGSLGTTNSSNFNPTSYTNTSQQPVPYQNAPYSAGLNF